MDKFALGLITAIMFTTPDGKAITEKATKVGVKLGDKYLKSKFNIDVKSILDEEKNTEFKSAETKKPEKELKRNVLPKNNKESA